MQYISDAADMQKAIRHSYMKDNLDVTLLTNLSEMLCKPERLNIYVHSKQLKNECILQEDFMMTKFFVSDMPKELYSAITEPANVLQMNNLKIAIPRKNQLLPTDFSIKEFNPKYTG